MRTTLTIDDTLIKELKEIAHRRGMAFKEVVNRALAAGLRAMQSPPRATRRKATTYSMGEPKVPDLDAALHLAADLEAEEIARKLELRK